MAGEFLFTLGSRDDVVDSVKGSKIQGRGEPRIAFVGRSNVGKSSLINALLGQKLARASSEPGKTRCLHGYAWKEPKKIVMDLPGYGYAKQAKEERDRWADFIDLYLRTDESLERVAILLDSRHGPSEKDLEAIQFFIDESFPLIFIMTKKDQIKTQSERAKRMREVTDLFRKMGYDEGNIHWVAISDRSSIEKLKKALTEEAPPTEMKE